MNAFQELNTPFYITENNLVVKRHLEVKENGSMYSPMSACKINWKLQTLIEEKTGIFVFDESEFYNKYPNYVDKLAEESKFMWNIKSYIGVIPAGTVVKKKEPNEFITCKMILLTEFCQIEDFIKVRNFINKLNDENKKFDLIEYQNNSDVLELNLTDIVIKHLYNLRLEAIKRKEFLPCPH